MISIFGCGKSKLKKKEFKDSPNTSVFTTKFVLDDNKTITYVTHDNEDGSWQFFSDDKFENFSEVAKIVGLKEIVKIDSTLLELADLPLGYYATRKHKTDKWNIVQQPIKTTEHLITKDYQISTIELNIEKETSLMILLHKDGTINRKGYGTYEIDNNFYMGIDKNNLLSELTKSITPDFESLLNKVIDYPEKKGKICTLEITLSDGKETTGVRYIYGSESMGPPIPIANFINKAIELTNPWYEKQVRIKE